MRILVTGASGFVGRALIGRLASEGHIVRAVTRELLPDPPAETCLVPDIVAVDWRPLLVGVDAVVHLAARVHQLRDGHPNPLLAFREVNRDATLRLAQAAIQSGIRRFVFISSVKAAVESTGLNAIDEDHPADPHSDYGISKREAEQGLLALAGRNGFAPVILRLPLVYGAGVKGNLPLLFKLVKAGLPLPLGAIINRRSLLGLGNLLPAIELGLQMPGVGGKIFYLEDTTLSTPELLRQVGEALHRQPVLLPVPPQLLALAAKLAGQGDKYERLGGSLAVSSARFREAAGWRPAIPMLAELEKIAASPYL